MKSGAHLTQAQGDRLNTITTIYEQQRILYERNTHSIPDRILTSSLYGSGNRGLQQLNAPFPNGFYITLSSWTSHLFLLFRMQGIRYRIPCILFL